MDELKKRFLEEVIRALEEDISRDEKWLKEDQIFKKIVESLQNTKPTDIVFDGKTQEELFQATDAVVTKIPSENLTMCFAYSPLKDYNQDDWSAYNALTKILFVSLYNFNLKLTKTNLNKCIHNILSVLQRDDVQAIVHHELAHKLFADNFNDMQKLFEFKKKWFKIDYHKRHEEYNSFLSEIYDYAINKTDKLFYKEKDVIKFALELLNSSSPYLIDLGKTIAGLDLQKLSSDLSRFARKKMMKNAELSFEKFKDYLLKNNETEFKWIDELTSYISEHKNEEIVKDIYKLQQSLDHCVFYNLVEKLICELSGTEFKEIVFEDTSSKVISNEITRKMIPPGSFTTGVKEKDIPFVKDEYDYKKRLVAKFKEMLKDEELGCQDNG